jgi:hypothetical protein
MSDLEVTEGELSRIINRSREFGRRIRELEDKDEWDKRRLLRTEWRRFSNHLPSRLRTASIDAYYDEYVREPTDGEYKE